MTVDPAEPLATLLAASRLLAAPADEVEHAILREAANAFVADGVALLGAEDRAAADMIDRGVRFARTADGVLLLLGGHERVIALTLPAPVASDVAIAFADAATAALDRRRAKVEHDRVLAQHQALTRAAKTLNGTLELDTVLARICHEASQLPGCTTAIVFRGSPRAGLTVAAAIGVPPEEIGQRLAPGAGLAGKGLRGERAVLTNDLMRIADTPPGFRASRTYGSAMAAPMAWDGELRGVLSVGWEEDARLTSEDLVVLETFAELAA